MHALPFSPASASLAGIPARLLFLLIPLAGVAVFTWMMARRVAPLLKAAPDPRFDNLWERTVLVLKVWLAQWRHPRYLLAGVLHIVLFLGFLVLGLRSFQLIFLGFMETCTLPGFGGLLGAAYNVAKDYAATAVFLSVVVLAYRRGIVRPARYAVPKELGKDHTGEAILVLGLIATLLLSESAFEGSLLAAGGHGGAAPFRMVATPRPSEPAKASSTSMRPFSAPMAISRRTDSSISESPRATTVTEPPSRSTIWMASSTA